MLFLIVIDAVMQNVNQDRQHGIQWCQVDKLEDLINETGKTGLIINVKKTKALRVNTNKTEPITLRGESNEDVDSFANLGSTVTKDRGTAQDVLQ